ncbi:hypothetical protein [Rhizobium sp. L1K21]|uniref:hypothetical protein n=1 Tax=Rhizobium sp. L1K21 TaxID=2954933 RepID=UPI0020935DF7|nr:hypothetical protein [Rhizobium sp. L1K21]MCO6188087.1 hypothetical protein [Rhizobium sp. L1K21]
MQMDILQLFTVFFSAIAAFVSFQTYRLQGRKRSAELRQAWLNDLREKVANVFAETAKWETSKIDSIRLQYLMEYIDMMLDMSCEHHSKLKNALFPVALNAESGNEAGLREAYNTLGASARSFFNIEQNEIRRGLERWI